MAAFDASSVLLATRLDESPSTLWVWDLASAELRAVLMFHSSVTFSWHPTVPELLAISCQDEAFRGQSYIWDPLSEGPRSVCLADHVPEAKAGGKHQSRWLNTGEESPVLLLSDTSQFVLVSLNDSPSYPESWSMGRGSGDPFDLTGNASLSHLTEDDENEHSILDDTFSFKRK